MLFAVVVPFVAPGWDLSGGGPISVNAFADSIMFLTLATIVGNRATIFVRSRRDDGAVAAGCRPGHSSSGRHTGPSPAAYTLIRHVGPSSPRIRSDLIAVTGTATCDDTRRLWRWRLHGGYQSSLARRAFVRFCRTIQATSRSS